jgi:predicted outer membrane lipoprotein
MATVLLSCLFGVVGAMVLWVAGTAAAQRDQMMGRGGTLSRPEKM